MLGGLLQEVGHRRRLGDEGEASVSEYTVMTTGIGISGSSSLVCALNALQNSMMLTPR